MAELRGKVALVTGGGSGIGQAACLLYARDGVRVAVTDVNEAGGRRTVRAIQDGGGEALFIRTDVASPEACQAAVQQTVERFGRLDIAFNNAGIGGEANPTADYSAAGWQQVIDINLSGVFYCMKYEIPAMLQNGGGAIVNMSSILGQVGFGGSPAYVAAKHGVVGLTKNTALEYSAQGVRVNAIGPAFIRTPMIAALENDAQMNSLLVSMHPIGRLGDPDEVAELVIWLSSDKASYVTGAYYAVDGGFLAR